MKRNISIILVLLAHAVGYSQMRTVETTPTALASRLPGFSQVTTVTTKSFAYTPSVPPGQPTPVDEDTTTEHSDIYNYADLISTSITTANGNTTATSAGKVWTLRISIPNALNVGFIFNQFNLSSNAELYIYNDEKTILKDSITKSRFTNSTVVTIASVPTTGLTIYLLERGNTGALQSTISINEVWAGYQPIYDVGSSAVLAKASVNCDPMIQCQPAKLDQARSVARVHCEGAYFSGALINNELNNGRPYFLTAYHCVDRNNNNKIDAFELDYLTKALFRFQFWKTTCNGTRNNAMGEFVGAVLVKSDRTSDVALLELTNGPGIGDGVNYAGWDRTSNAPSNSGSFVIHHPQTQDMRISNTRKVEHYLLNNNYWSVHYSSGTTDEGSSGSPLFNNNGLIVGQLKGGWSNCNYTDFADRYGRFDKSWGVLQSALSPALNTNLTTTVITYPVTIIGPSGLTCNQQVQYNVPAFYGCTFYWTVGPNLTIIQGQTTAALTVKATPSNANTNVQVTITDSKGISRILTVSKAITLSAGTPSMNFIAAPGACSGTTQNFTFSATPSSGGTNWNWSVDYTSPGGLITIQQPTSASTPATVKGAGRVKLTYTDLCGIAQTAYLAGVNSTCSSRMRYKINPNPASSYTVITSSLDYGSSSDIRTVRLFSNTGILRIQWAFGKGTTKVNLNVSNLGTGNYYLEISDGATTERQSLLIKIN